MEAGAVGFCRAKNASRPGLLPSLSYRRWAETPPKLSSRESFRRSKLLSISRILDSLAPVFVHISNKIDEMPAVIEDDAIGATDGGIATLPFPPITKAHIMNCSYHSWHPKYARLQDLYILYPY